MLVQLGAESNIITSIMIQISISNIDFDPYKKVAVKKKKYIFLFVVFNLVHVFPYTRVTI